MPITGTTIFSHIVPVILGFFGILGIIIGSLDEDKKIYLIGGVILFIFAAMSPFLVLRLMGL